MSLLEDLRASQHMERKYQSDEQLEVFLQELDPAVPILDLLPSTEVEIRHLTHTKRIA